MSAAPAPSSVSAPASLRGWRRACAGAVLWALPLLACAHGTIHERLDQLNKALALQPDDAALRCQLAGVYCEHGDWREALAELDRAEALAPGRNAVDLRRGDALLTGGRPAVAKAALDRFLAAHPAHPDALLLRARALGALKQAEPSLADYRAALKATPRPEPDLVQEVADALAAHGHADEAMQVLAAALVRLGPVPSLALRALELETAAGRFDAALTRIDALQKTAPRPEPWMAKRAALLAKAGRVAGARAAWQALVAHLDALPNLERGSPSLRDLADQARQALDALPPLSAVPNPPATSS